jgi:hypothetical protein
MSHFTRLDFCVLIVIYGREKRLSQLICHKYKQTVSGYERDNNNEEIHKSIWFPL